MTPSAPESVTVGPLPGESASDLMAQSQALQASLYPAESVHQVEPTELATPPNLLLGAHLRSLPDTAVGCVGLLCEGQEPGIAEIKSLFVTPDFRNQGIAAALMDALEHRARALGISVVRLETGIYQPESVGLYTGRGYSVIPRFGHYPDDPLSVFMEKRLL